ncbi:MAG: 2Fe-2S iron-sulfur cluster-binding protein [Woeseiaceae bacterium]|nr:2Fe-2S iron-sulfur cluster-binding protein [Woeseiaceae bacterium]
MTGRIRVDGQSIPFAEGQTVIEAAQDAGVFIPHLCYHPDYEANGSCKMCTCKIDGRQVSSCTTRAEEGMVVESNTEELNSERRALAQMLFVEGNHHCPSCEHSGNCVLQSQAYRLGMTALIFPDFTAGRETDATHPDILLNRDRCIYCELCVRASRDTDGKDIFAITGRSQNKGLAINSDSGLLKDSGLSVDDAAANVCPVGCIIKKGEAFTKPIGQRDYDHRTVHSNKIKAPKLPALIKEEGEKVSVATCSLAGCFGCHMSFLDIDERIVKLIDHVQFDRSPINDLKHCSEEVDIGLVEGGVCNTENIETLREFRKSCKILIAVGACAMSGGVPALRNPVDVRELLEESYINGIGLEDGKIPTDPELPHILEEVSPIHEVVKIDFFLPGCPPPADAFWQILNDIVEGRAPDLPYDLLYFD